MPTVLSSPFFFIINCLFTCFDRISALSVKSGCLKTFFIRKSSPPFASTYEINDKRRYYTMNIPNDPVMLLSYINTQLRDFYPTLNELCSALNLSKDELCSKLSAIDYKYDEEANQFV
jgi:hypothetical protein